MFTIYALVFVGIAPLLLEVLLLLNGYAAGNEVSILFSVPVSIMVIISAISAWRGSDKARKTLLVFVTLHYVLIAINNYSMIKSELVPKAEVSRMWARVLRGFIYPALFIWYFNKDTTKDFYQEDEQIIPNKQT